MDTFVDGSTASDPGRQRLRHEHLARMIMDILDRSAEHATARDSLINTELEAIVSCIRSAKSEIAAIGTEQIRSCDIPNATDQLDAVVQATSEATNTILDVAEAIQSIALGLEEKPRAQLTDLSIKIFEASNFQDITGQRIAKVIGILRQIETKIGHLLEVLGDDATGGPGEGAATVVSRAEGYLLNGPAMPGAGVDQNDIDNLFA